jgi:hypothetical protein
MKRIPPFKLAAAPLDHEAANLEPFKWATGDVGQRHQLGGSPTFLQPTEWPICKACNQRMTFYGQLDSINDDFCIADCGVVFVFICFDCNEALAMLQSG